MHTNQCIVAHQNGTPLTEAELEEFWKPCPDCYLTADPENPNCLIPCKRHAAPPLTAATIAFIRNLRLEDIDTDILQNWIGGREEDAIQVKSRQTQARTVNFFSGVDEGHGRKFTIVEVRAEIDRRKGKPRLETPRQKYARLCRLPAYLITKAEEAFLRSREAALIARGL
jgi:hypothetical protein